MHVDAEVLTALSSWFSPGELPGVLTRILRVPEAWEQLHDPALLARIVDQGAPQPFTAAEIGRLVTARAISSKQDAAPGSDSFSARLETVWQQNVETPDINHNLEAVMMLAYGMIRYAQGSDGAKNLLALVLANPVAWRSPLACAWTRLPAPNETLSRLLSCAAPQAIALAANSLLANYSLADAAGAWLRAQPAPGAAELKSLRRLGEDALAGELSAHAGVQTVPSPIAELQYEAARSLIAADYPAARNALSRAWENATHDAAQVADDLADLAGAEEDPVMELEARQQALRLCATPQRRAALAQSLLLQGHTDEALQVLPQQDHAPAEHIAAGLVCLANWQEELGVAHFEAALPHAAELCLGEACWVSLLAGGLQRAGMASMALQAAALLARMLPTKSAARVTSASMLIEAGNPQAAVQEATLALAIDRADREARKLLAQALQSSGNPGAAIPHWQTLTDDASCLLDLAQCALLAGDLATAQDAAERALEAGVEPTRSAILIARSMAASGDLPAAMLRLQEATAADPNRAEAWIALAEIHQLAGNESQVDATFAAGVQAAPGNGALYHAYARWLRAVGRSTEALEAMEQAVALSPDQGEWLVFKGELQLNLGHQEQALSTLRLAIARQPGSWEPRQLLARLHESRDEIAAAWRQLARLPAEQPGEHQFLAGRIALKHHLSGAEDCLAAAQHFLQLAEEDGVSGAELDYWIGRSFEAAGDAPSALQRYQRCLDQQPGDYYIGALVGLASAALGAGLLEIALSALQDAQQRFPQDVQVLIGLSRAYLAAGLSEEAFHCARQAASLEPQTGDVLRQLSRAASSNHDWLEAIQALDKIEAQSAHKASDWIELAQAAAQAGSISATRAALARALVCQRRDPAVLKNVAAVLVWTDEQAAAQRLLERLAQVDPLEDPLLLELAALAERNGNLDLAAEAWLRYAELNPGDAEGLQRAAQVFWRLHRRAEAIGAWERSLSLDPSNSQTLASLGNAFLANGELERGSRHLLTALERQPEDPDLARAAGEALVSFGFTTPGIQALRRAHQLAPQNPANTAALCRALLAAGDADDCQRVLQQESSPSSSLHALAAQAFLLQGDLSRARQSLQDAQAAASAIDRQQMIDLLRTARLLMDWPTLEELLSSWNPGSDPQALQVIIEEQLHLANMRWLYAEIGGSQVAAPSPAAGIRLEAGEIDALLQQSRAAGLSSDTHGRLQRCAAIAAGELGIENFAALQSQPIHDPVCLESLVIGLIKSNQLAEAVDVLEQTAIDQPSQAVKNLLLGIALSAQGRFEAAGEAFAAAAANPALAPLANYLHAGACSVAGDNRQAIARLHEALAVHPGEPAWQFELGNLYLEQQASDLALPHLQQAADLAPENIVYRLALGRVLVANGQLSAAAEAFDELLPALPADGSAWHDAARVSLQTGNHQQALERFDHAAELMPRNAAILAGSARAALGLGQLRLARQKAQLAAQIAPNEVEVLVVNAEIQAAEGRIDQALETYQQALPQVANPISLVIARSRLLTRSRRMLEAIESLEGYTESAFDNDQLWAALAEAQLSAGLLEEAIRSASAASRLAPRNAEYRALLARACHHAGQLDRAIEELSQAEAIMPEAAAIPFELGQIFQTRRESGRALEAYQRAIALDPQHAAAHFQAGLLFKETKSYARAGAMLKRAAELNPENPDVMHQLAAVRALELVHGGFVTELT